MKILALDNCENDETGEMNQTWVGLKISDGSDIHLLTSDGLDWFVPKDGEEFPLRDATDQEKMEFKLEMIQNIMSL